MKVLIVCTLFAATQATYYFPSLVSSGISSQYRSQDDTGNYKFGYDEAHASGGTFRRETGDAFGNKYGSYGLSEADGRQRIVNYVADAGGYRADIRTNEPGVGVQEPASTTINKAHRIFMAAPAPSTVKKGSVFIDAPAPSTVKKGSVFIDAPSSSTIKKGSIYVETPTVTYVSRKSELYPMNYPTYVSYGHVSYPYAQYVHAPHQFVAYGGNYKGYQG